MKRLKAIKMNMLTDVKIVQVIINTHHKVPKQRTRQSINGGSVK